MDLKAAKLSDYDFLKEISWLDRSVFGNSLYAYLLTFASFVGIWVILHVVRAFAWRRIDKIATERGSDAWRFVRSLLYEIRPYIFPLIALFLASKRLTIPPTLGRGIKFVTLALVTMQVVALAGELVQFTIERARTAGRPDDLSVRSTSKNLIVIAKVLLWTGAILFLVDNAGFNVSAFVTGLGIGGIAIALATQAILGDAFSSFAITLDKPFEVGDFIVVDGLMGTVEHIGLKTTRVRSLGGEMLVFANSDLTKSRIVNSKRMVQRRVVFRLGLTYDTPTDKLRGVPAMLKQAVLAAGKTTFDRAHFHSFGDSALLFEVAYFVNDADYALHMDIRQAINFTIREAFEKEGIAMAFPTQTVHLAGDAPARR